MVEGNSKRPIYQLHKWWARRLGSVFRALILSSALSSTESEKVFWERYYNGLSLKELTLYDPMMGGGTSIVEGIRLGCKVIGADLNPVAWFVTKKEVEPYEEKATDAYFRKLEEAVGERVRALYKTRCLLGHDAEIVYGIWIRQVRCANCNRLGDLPGGTRIRERVVGKPSGKKVLATLVCGNPECENVFSSWAESPVCSRCGATYHPEVEVPRGMFKCKACKNMEKVTEATRRRGTFLESRLNVIQFHCLMCGTNFKKPDQHDLDLYHAASEALKANRKSLHFPRQRISVRGRADRRPVNHGFRYYSDLFNGRQLLALSITLNAIKRIPDASAREFLLLAFSASLETNNVLCKYESKWGKISALFGVPGYHVPNRYGENNLWGRGRGSFVRSYAKLKRGKKYAMRPYEVLFEYGNLQEGTRGQKMYLEENVSTMVNHSAESEDQSRPLILCTDSRRVPEIRDKTVDIVLTDPPYYDNLVYSELADFFYVWLRLVLKREYEYFSGQTSRRKQEILVNEHSKKGGAKFASDLARVLKECKRVLKDEGLIVFTFHHSNPVAWASLRRAISSAGLFVTASPVLRSEGKSGYRAGNINYDVVVVCRKLPLSYRRETEDADYLFDASLDSVREIYALDRTISDSDILTVVMGTFLRIRGKATRDLTESVGEAVVKLRNSLREPEEVQPPELKTLQQFGSSSTPDQNPS
ncbi:MAG: DUF1156 domain-containing protein [archaeon]|nr:MAG: DUF1156 domain-containing protein [archaeon]